MRRNYFKSREVKWRRRINNVVAFCLDHSLLSHFQMNEMPFFLRFRPPYFHPLYLIANEVAFRLGHNFMSPNPWWNEFLEGNLTSSLVAKKADDHGNRLVKVCGFESINQFTTANFIFVFLYDITAALAFLPCAYTQKNDWTIWTRLKDTWQSDIYIICPSRLMKMVENSDVRVYSKWETYPEIRFWLPFFIYV